jgi:predicted metal-dependent phosphoesterase TrpH
MSLPVMRRAQVPQDLHIHTVYSAADSSVVAEQTRELVAAVAHARVLGISDHFEFVIGRDWERYVQNVR